MPADSEYGDDIQLLDDLTRLKLRLIDKKLKPGTSPRYRRRSRVLSPDYSPSPSPPPERRRERFYRKIDKRNELLQKLWEELGNGDSRPLRRYSAHLPPLSPRYHSSSRRENYEPWMYENLWDKTGNTKKDLMEMMLIQNAQMQQWMMTQTLQRRQGESDARIQNHYYDAAGRPLPPIRNVADAGSQYPQDFFDGRQQPQYPRVVTPFGRRSYDRNDRDYGNGRNVGNDGIFGNGKNGRSRKKRR